MAELTLNQRLPLLMAICISIAASALSAQTNTPQPPAPAKSAATDTKPLAFDVVSIKRNISGSGTGSNLIRPDGFHSVNVSLATYLYRGLSGSQVFGAPAWLQSELYDIDAKVASSDLDAYHHATQAERNRMLQAVFEDRLKLKLHQETRQLPLYLLVMAKGGLKLKSSPENTQERQPPANSNNEGQGLYWVPLATPGETRIVGQPASIARLAQRLSYMSGIDRPVVDKTGLTGKYDFTLDWSSSDEPSSTAPSIFTALQEQLGLKLESAKGPVAVLVIDHIERPSEN
jgi:uncharacterized protein (TIGR03435 family)